MNQKTKITITDYGLTVENEATIIKITLGQVQRVKDVMNLTKDIVEMTTRVKDYNEQVKEEQLKQEEQSRGVPDNQTIPPLPDPPPGGMIDGNQLKSCPTCHRIFTKKRKNQTYCSKKCAKIGYKLRHEQKKKSIVGETEPKPVSKANYDPLVNPITGKKE